jgi:hypothetical protein
VRRLSPAWFVGVGHPALCEGGPRNWATLGWCYDGTIMVVRTQVSLDAEMHQRAKRRARERGISFAEYIRQVVDSDLGGQPKTDISEIFGIGDSGGSNVARHKQQYLDEAVLEEYERKTGRAPE